MSEAGKCGICGDPYDYGPHECSVSSHMDEFKEAAKPLIQFLNKYCNPHMKVIVENDSAELVGGEMGFTTKEYLKD